MEIKVFMNFDAYSQNKPVFCQRVECQSVFEPAKCVDVFKSIYGNGVVVLIMWL